MTFLPVAQSCDDNIAFFEAMTLESIEASENIFSLRKLFSFVSASLIKRVKRENNFWKMIAFAGTNSIELMNWMNIFPSILHRAQRNHFYFQYFFLFFQYFSSCKKNANHKERNLKYLWNLKAFRVTFISLLESAVNVNHREDLPIIRSDTVRCVDGCPAKPLAPHAAPPRAHATPPKAIIAIKPNDLGLWKNWPQHPFRPECSDGDLKFKSEKGNLNIFFGFKLA